ncbi:MAG: putative ATPase [Myxococcota bacterium]|jgi:predicted ATPase
MGVLNIWIAVEDADVGESARKSVSKTGHRALVVDAGALMGDFLVPNTIPDVILTSPGYPIGPTFTRSLVVRLPDGPGGLAIIDQLFKSAERGSSTIALADGVVDLIDGLVAREGVLQTLTATEQALLQYLAVRRTASVEALQRDVWGYADGVLTNAVKTTVHRVRRKIERDPRRPVHLLTRAGGGYRLDPRSEPAPRPDATRSTNVSRPPPCLFGRQPTVEELKAKLEAHSLVTITGPPGMGKTHLSLDFAWRAAQQERAVWTVFLLNARTLKDVVTAIERAIATQPEEIEDAHVRLDVLGALLDEVQAPLLVLDNGEHILEIVREVITALLTGAPHLNILLTSREATGLPQEATVALGPLPVEAAAALLAESLKRLTWGRADAEADPDDLTRIATAVDCVPLALVLAAGRGDVLSPREIATHLAGSFALLEQRQASHVPSYREAVGWSWDLLATKTRRALVCSCLFPDGFSVDELVATLGPAAPQIEVLDQISDLVAKSLVHIRAHMRDGKLRFFVLPLLARHVLEREDARLLMDRALERRAIFMTERAEIWLAAYQIHRRRLVESRPTLLAMWQDRHRTQTSLGSAAEAIVASHIAEGSFPNALGFSESALKDKKLSPQSRGSLIALQAWSLHHTGRHVAAVALAAKAIEMLEPCGGFRLVRALCGQALLARDDVAVARAIALATSHQGRAEAHFCRAQLAIYSGRPEDAEPDLLIAESTWRGTERCSRVQLLRSVALISMGRPDLAVDLLTRITDRAPPYARMRAMAYRGIAMQVLGDPAAALEDLDAAVASPASRGMANFACQLHLHRALAHLDLADRAATDASCDAAEALLTRSDAEATHAQAKAVRSWVSRGSDREDDGDRRRGLEGLGDYVSVQLVVAALANRQDRVKAIAGTFPAGLRSLLPLALLASVRRQA